MYIKRMKILRKGFFNENCKFKINYVRLRIHHVLRFIKEQNIDVMCLGKLFLFKFVKVFIKNLLYFFHSSELLKSFLFT